MLVVTEEEFRALLDWFMCSDPFPIDKEQLEYVTNVLDKVSHSFGYDSWVDAYHKLKI